MALQAFFTSEHDTAVRATRCFRWRYSSIPSPLFKQTLKDRRMGEGRGGGGGGVFFGGGTLGLGGGVSVIRDERKSEKEKKQEEAEIEGEGGRCEGREEETVEM